MTLATELEAIAAAALSLAAANEQLAAVLPTEAASGRRIYLCAYAGADESPTGWVALDAAGAVVSDRVAVREAVSIAALCELAEDTAAGGDLDELLRSLVALRVTENPPGIEEAEEAVTALQRALGRPPQLATPQRLDAIGAATRRLEQALGGPGDGSPFAQVLHGAPAVVELLAADVEGAYRGELR